MVRIVLVALTLACGARTPLEVGDEAPAFETFPCRWSWGGAVDLGSASTRSAGLGGGIHSDLELAYVVAPGPLASGFSITLPMRSVRGVSGERLPPGTRAWGIDDDLWLFSPSACVGEGRDLDAQPTLSFAVVIEASTVSRCFAGAPHESGMVAAGFDVSTSSARVAVWHRGLVREATVPLVLADASFYPVVSDGEVYLFERVAGMDTIYQLPPTGDLQAQTFDGNEILGLDADRLRGGLVLLTRDEGRLVVQRVAPGVLGATTLARLDELPEPWPEPGNAPDLLVTTETDAMFVIGTRVAWVPLSGSDPRWTDPVPDNGAEGLRLLIRPGASLGGVVYERPEGSEWVTVFRSLVCNR